MNIFATMVVPELLERRGSPTAFFFCHRLRQFPLLPVCMFGPYRTILRFLLQMSRTAHLLL